MLACLPFTITEELDPGAVHEQVQRASRAAIRDLDWPARVFCLRHSVEKSGTGQSSPANFSRLAIMPEVWRNGSLNRILTVRQNYMAASENTAGRPGRPSGGARQAMSLSTR